MFKRLQNKWKVNGLQLVLILCTFAIGGSLTGLAGRKIMAFLPIDKGFLWVLTYVVIVTLIWPFAVLAVSLFFGQFGFFTSYLKKMGNRMKLTKSAPISPNSDPKSTEMTPNSPKKPVKLAIFASGAGSNAGKLIEHFRHNQLIFISLVVSNKSTAGVLNIAKSEQIPVLLIEKEPFFTGDGYVAALQEQEIDWIILAGFLWKVPDTLIAAFPNRIINIHPALLPKFGGKGMYGANVHKAVIEAGETESGITIHFVDGHYDHGATIFQATCPVAPGDTHESLAAKVHALEHRHFPQVIEKLITNK